MQHDFEGVGVGSDDDEVGDTSVESFSGLVGALLDLLERRTLRNKVVDAGGELFGGERLGTLGDFLPSQRGTMLLIAILL